MTSQSRSVHRKCCLILTTWSPVLSAQGRENSVCSQSHQGAFPVSPHPHPPPTPALIFPRAVGRRLEWPQGNQVTVPLTDQQSQEAIWLKDTDMVAEVGGP